MKVNLRSPFHIYINDTNLTKAIIELYIYNDTKVATIPSVTYSIESTAFNNSVTFEIAELIRDYIDYTFIGRYLSKTVFCNYRITKYISGVAQTPEVIVQLECLDGYGYFEDFENPQLNQMVLQSNKKIYTWSDSATRIPIFLDTNKTVTYSYQGNVLFTSNYLAQDHPSFIIGYVTNFKMEADTYKDRVLTDGTIDIYGKYTNVGTFEDSECLRSFLCQYDIGQVDTITVTDNTIPTAIKTEIIKVEKIEENKYQPYKVTFINKFGALQDLWFFKRSNLSLTTTDEKYKANILSNGKYSISSHQNRLLKKQGVEKLTLNSGFYPEEYNEVFRQLLLSEKVWIEIDSKTLPINITSSSFAFKTQLNDKLITYTIEVDFAFDKINNIR